ncbi:MAG: hypothetical protein N2652_09915 [Kiritimatiellae bacterium]|nr:hypothetical protein [Kiritimatiellia bacterium]
MSARRRTRSVEHHEIMGLHITERTRHAPEVQQVLTRHGRIIQTRLGLHDVHGREGSPNGLIVLHLVGSDAEVAALERDLRAIEGVDVQRMTFRH